MTDELEPVMLSALQHYLYCPRQCALIHVEGAWAENFLTASGRQLHERTDSGVHETREGLHRATSLRLFSRRLGLTGVADVVEFKRKCSNDDVADAVQLPGMSGWWRPYPVEYKRGHPKEHRADEVQLCAQAICLEEMFSISIGAGALFYGAIRRRMDVLFDSELRTLTERTVSSVRRMCEFGNTPAAVWNKGCEACSIANICRPRETDGKQSAKKWLHAQVVNVLRT